MKRIFSIMGLALCAFTTSSAQHYINISGDDTINNKGTTLTVGTGGIKVNKPGVKKHKKFEVQVGMLDLGFNNIQDKTNYNSPEAQNFLHVNQDQKNSNLFSLREGKSVNVNIWPVLLKYNALKTHNQKITIATGVGLQIYDFRYNKPISFQSDPNPAIIMDSLSFSKNKLGMTYLSVPLMFNFKTRLADKLWLVYGVGVTGGYRISSWTKQISDERGKDKNHDSFNFQDFNACLTGEIGLDDYIRLYATYQVTNMYKNSLDQHPFAIGVRFLGI